MILRRADNLSETDNVRLDDLLWNVSRVEVSPSEVYVRLTRSVGATRELALRPDDLVQLAI